MPRTSSTRRLRRPASDLGSSWSSPRWRQTGRPAAERADVTGTTSAALGAKAYDEYHVFVRVAEPGHYYVEFLAPLAKSEFIADKEIPPDAKNWWGATRLEVKKRDITPPPR